MISEKYPINPMWALADTFTVHQAAALICSVNPYFVNHDCSYFSGENWNDSDGIESVSVAYTVLIGAITDCSLKAIVRHDACLKGWDEHPNHGESERPLSWEEEFSPNADNTTYGVIYRTQPDWQKTTITRQNLIDWLKRRGVTTGFFFNDSAATPANEQPDTPDYLNPKHPHYTPKLAAAVKAWLAFADTDITRTSPKTALVKWLEKNAAELELLKPDGTANNAGIDDVAKVANWNLNGGAPGTPG